MTVSERAKKLIQKYEIITAWNYGFTFKSMVEMGIQM